jgi:hypothetical protein
MAPFPPERREQFNLRASSLPIFATLTEPPVGPRSLSGLFLPTCKLGDNRRGVERAGCYHANMPEQPRPDAPTDEHTFLLSVEEAADRYAAAGHPRTIRAIQKYCRRGDLESQKVETTYGERYVITPASIDRHIAMIIERSQANIREQPRPGAPVRSLETREMKGDEQFAAGREQPRPGAAGEYVEQLQKRLTEKDDEIGFLRSEISVKNDQIKELSERSRETNILIGGLQKMLTPLLGRRPDRDEPNEVAGRSSSN